MGLGLGSEVGTVCIPGQVCLLLRRRSLVLTCVACLQVEEEEEEEEKEEEEEEEEEEEGRLRSSPCVSGTPLVFRLRYAFQVLQNTILQPQWCLNPG